MIGTIIYVLLGVPYETSHEFERPAMLGEQEISQYVGAFEGAFAAISEAEKSALIDPDHWEDITNILQQIALVRQRPSAKTQQLELLIVELMEILNGTIEDEEAFREEFERLCEDRDTAVVAAHELVKAIELARTELGTNDPKQSGSAMKKLAEVDDELSTRERTWRDRVGDAAIVVAAKEAAEGAVDLARVGLRMYGDDALRIARELIRAFGRIARDWFDLG